MQNLKFFSITFPKKKAETFFPILIIVSTFFFYNINQFMEEK